ncbi:MAG TPA: SGNH/GDSL hydrolase family protein, partial [Rhodoglobus sp.]|nr:SGNH/GDSL hydrolase family protein [Rhodoglobus sp.]
LAVLVAAAVALAPAAPADDLDGLEYVALGDSYAAGLGLDPVAGDQPAAACFQSAGNYPHRVAEALGLDLDDRTCSGAVTADIRDRSQSGAPPQSDTLSADTDVVTVTIGGNDLGFGAIATGCLSLGARGPAVAHREYGTCRAYYTRERGLDELLTRVQQTVFPDVERTFAQIREQAPNATVFVVGYPGIAPSPERTPADCFSSPIGAGGLRPDAFPYQALDVVYLHQVEQQLDTALRRAADRAGFEFVPVWAASQSHAACSEQPFVSGITLTTDPAQGSAIGIDGAYLTRGALHPNEHGVAFLAQQVSLAIRAELDADDPVQRVLRTVRR